MIIILPAITDGVTLLPDVPHDVQDLHYLGFLGPPPEWCPIFPGVPQDGGPIHNVQAKPN